MNLSHPQPVEKLSRERPLGNIFNLYVLLSVLLQFALHIVSLIYITQLSRVYEECVQRVVTFPLADNSLQAWSGRSGGQV